MTASRSGKSQAAFRTISEVADELDVAQHVLRFWESKFPQVRPLKRGGGRRYYRPEDIELLRDIRALLYDEGYTIKGAQKLLRQRRARPAAGAAAKPSATAASADEPPASQTASAVPLVEAASEPMQQQLDPTLPLPSARSGSTSRSLPAAGPDAAAAATPQPASAEDDLERLRQVRDALVSLRRDLADLQAADGG